MGAFPERAPSEQFGLGEEFPIYWVNYAAAEAFCRTISAQAVRSGTMPPSWEFRLPTEAQWEYACRAATLTATSFGDQLGRHQANFHGAPLNGGKDGAPRRATPVGSYPPNHWDLSDMHGNIFELCKRGAEESCLTGPIRPLRNRAMLIRTEQAMDFSKIHTINRVAFDSATEADVVDVLRSGAENVISLVAEEDGEIVGHIMFSPVQLTGAADVRAMALAPMAVTPQRQRAGIGSALVRAGIEECQRRGIDAVFVVGHPTYYPRFGFKPASSVGFACEFDVPDEAFLVVELVAGVLDGKTATVHFHPAFKEG